MKAKKKKQGALTEYIKASRKGSREAEIEDHGRPVSYNRVHTSKKVYNRKKTKADDQRRLPYLFITFSFVAVFPRNVSAVVTVCIRQAA